MELAGKHTSPGMLISSPTPADTHPLTVGVIMYRTWLIHRDPENGRQYIVTVYFGASRRSAVQAYNNLSHASSSNPNVREYGWTVID